MAIKFTTNELIESIKTRAMIPENQVTFKEEDFLRFANEELDLGVVPFVMGLHEDYFLKVEKITLVSQQDNYPVPYRAIGNKAREVAYQDTNNNIFEMSRVGIGDIPHYQSSFISQQFRIFYMQGRDIVIVPSLGSGDQSGFLRVTYYCRPK